MIKTILGAILVLVAVLTGCQRPSPSAEPSTVATTTVADTQGVLSRFTTEIWPLVSASNEAPPDQLSQNPVGLSRVIYRNVPMEVRAHLEESIQHLGTVWRNKDNKLEGEISWSASPLTLVDTPLTALDSSKATLQICYTYVSASYGATINDPLIKNPAASEATVELRKTDNWYLYSITDDHVVPGCSASPKV